MFLGAITGYTVFTILSAFSTGLYDFVAYQFIARMFMVTEIGLGAIILTEEMPARWRGAAVTLTFAASLGETEVHEVFTPLAGHPEISVLEHDAERPPVSDSWHSDVSYRPEPSMASVLYARDIPANGGDTLWLSAYAAYDALSGPLQEFFTGLHAETISCKPMVLIFVSKRTVWSGSAAPSASRRR